MDGNYDNAYERRSNFRSLVMLLSQPGSDMLCDSNRLITKYFRFGFRVCCPAAAVPAFRPEHKTHCAVTVQQLESNLDAVVKAPAVRVSTCMSKFIIFVWILIGILSPASVQRDTPVPCPCNSPHPPDESCLLQ
jgi:hypothetical protein